MRDSARDQEGTSAGFNGFAEFLTLLGSYELYPQQRGMGALRVHIHRFRLVIGHRKRIRNHHFDWETGIFSQSAFDDLDIHAAIKRNLARAEQGDITGITSTPNR